MSAGLFFVLRIFSGQFMLVFLVCFLCAFIAVFWIYVALFLMSIVWLGSVLCDPNTYPHKSPGLRDSAAQMADRELQSAGPPILLTSVDTPFGCRPCGLNGKGKFSSIISDTLLWTTHSPSALQKQMWKMSPLTCPTLRLYNWQLQCQICNFFSSHSLEPFVPEVQPPLLASIWSKTKKKK